ncbi:MAG: bifunctional riboflavin kinase/FAD synthetase [Lewinellaceae bacterium]|nr:bifunctional riboflavin kinase/FAD synthetase [Lewinellaceae bacterium]
MNVYRDINNIPAFQNAVITIGSFDGVHRGHQKILDRVINLANEYSGDSVVITFHPHPRHITDTQSQPVQLLNTLDEKLFLLEKIGIKNVVVVPFTFEFSRMVPREYVENFLIQKFNPKFIVVGYDHRFGLNRGGDFTLLSEYAALGHFKIVEIPKYEIDDIAISSTKVRNAIIHGNIEEANAQLVHPYVLCGRVIHGDKLGSKLGYPTANLQVSDKDKLIPREGVYAVRTDIDGALFEGMMYIGKRPTVSQQDFMNIEVNLFDFNDNIYNKNIRIEILNFIRGDIKFDSLEDLKIQLAKDEEEAVKSLEKIKTKYEDTPIVTIAVLNYNGKDLLESYLPMLSYSSSKYAVDFLLIDNNSEDNSIQYVSKWHPEFKIIELSKNYGFAEGYNKGLMNVKSPYVVIINSDVLVTENWLDPLIDALEKDPHLGIVQPTILSLEDKKFYEYAGAAGGFIDILGYPFCRGRLFNTIEKITPEYDDPVSIFWASGAAMACKTSLFKNIGGFDGAFFAHQEEIDLCWRVQRAGFGIKCIPTSKVHHLGGGTLQYQDPHKDFLNFRNNLYTILKNESFLRTMWVIPFRLILDGIAGIKFLLSGQPLSTLAVIKAHLSFYIHLPFLLERANKEYIWIRKVKKSPAKLKGKYLGSIVWKYYIEGKRSFKELTIHGIK